jgi:Ca-activated chloride channel family protein
MTPDDPTLTAYALGDPISAADRARIESALASDESLRAEVEAIRTMAGQLSAALATEPAPPLPALKPLVIRRRTPLLHLAAASVAAAVLIGWAGYAIGRSTRQEVALNGYGVLESASPATVPAVVDASAAQAALGHPIDLKVQQASLDEVMQAISSQTGLNLIADYAAIEATGIEAKKTPITLDVRSLPARRVLELALEQVGGGVTALSVANDDGVVRLTTQQDAARYVVTRTYDIRDLIGRTPDFTNAPDFNLDASGGRIGGGSLFGAPGGEMKLRPGVVLSGGERHAGRYAGVSNSSTDLNAVGSTWTDTQDASNLPALSLNFAEESKQLRAQMAVDVPAAPASRDEAIQSVIALTQTVVDNDTWKDNGGLIGSIQELGGQLIVTQTEEGHEKIAKLLTELRAHPLVPPQRPPEVAPLSTESYAAIYDNPFLTALAEPLSTFSVDVDTASYANVRRFLQSNQLPPADAVRIEELVNYFPYHYAAPAAEDPAPFRANVELAECPWNANAKLLRVALKGKEIAREARPASNLVFLIDVSGSMNEPNKLPLVKQSLAKLVQQLDERDTVSIVVYAGASGLALPPTRGDQKQTILNAINELTPGGSTNGAAGIELAYQLAVEQFLPQGTNRVMLLTDGDFNVGISDRASLVKLIEEKAKTKVYLSVLGFGTGNLKDATMEELAGKGNGNAAYIDSEREAQKVLVEQMSGTLVTIAMDVKLQLEFNPRLVKRYRLIGYENRMLQKQDFNDDKKDAGDIGAGHAVTALYEIEPVAQPSPLPAGPHPVDARGTAEVDPLRYQTPAQLSAAANAEELGTLKLRYKDPTADAVQGTSKLIEVPIASASKSFDQASEDFRFASSVAGFGMLVRGSPHRGSLTWPAVKAMAQASLGDDAGGYRAEFLTLIEKASTLRRN